MPRLAGLASAAVCAVPHLQLWRGGLAYPCHALQQLPKHAAAAPHVNRLGVAAPRHDHLHTVNW
jgi:hypothetical protein